MLINELPLPSAARRAGYATLLLMALVVLLVGQRGGAQSLSYSRGQNASPAFEGWEENPDGSFNFLFGYMNRNWEEELDVPVGPDNAIEPGGPDRGQPTHFLPRRNRFVFKVRVPKEWGEKELTWTLTTRGKTEKAYATLRTDSKVDDVVKASETGALGAGTSSPEVRSNKPPEVKLDGARTRGTKVGEPLSLVAWVTDDGIPKQRSIGVDQTTAAARRAEAEGRRVTNPALVPPQQATVGKRVGLHLSWFVYRGTGRVTFDPPQIKVWEDTRTGSNSPWAPLFKVPEPPQDGKWEARATFEEPGTFVLRARADDGALVCDEDVTVNVTR
jgi:hypothetical protein